MSWKEEESEEITSPSLDMSDVVDDAGWYQSMGEELMMLENQLDTTDDDATGQSECAESRSELMKNIKSLFGAGFAVSRNKCYQCSKWGNP